MEKRTAEYWIEKLKLDEHPCCPGNFLEVFRDPFQVKGATGEDRAASTHIYFLHRPAKLDNNTVFFRVQSAEMIHFYTGEPLTLYYMPDNDSTRLEKIVLGPDPDKGHRFFFAFPRDRWFTRLLESDDPEAIAVIGSTVSPGFDFNDMKTATYEAIGLSQAGPDLKSD